MANTGVTGRIVLAGTTTGISGLTVRAYDIDPISGDDFLGSDKTVDGNFTIAYTPDQYRPWFTGALGEQPDIEVRVYGDGDRLLWETPKQDSVDDDVLVIPTIEIHENNLRVPEDRSDAERMADPYWLVTHTSLNPANGQAVRLTEGNQLDWLVDGAAMFPAVTDDIARGLPEQPGQPPNPAVPPVTSVKLMNMAFDAEGLVSKFDFTPKTPQTVEATDVVTVRKLGPLLVKQAARSVPVHVLVWDLEDSIGGGVGGFLDSVDDADEVRKFFQSTSVRFGTFRSTQLLHVKLIVVDGTTAYVIGSTMKQGYSGDQQHLMRDGRHGVPNATSKKGNRQLMHDVSLRLKGPSVRSVDQTFSTIWAAGNENTPAPAPMPAPVGGPDGRVGLQVLRTLPGEIFITGTPGPDVEHLPHGETGILESYQRAIMKAEEYIYIEDQYFNSPEIVAAIKLRMEEKERLEVILVVNARPDIGGYHEQQVELITDLCAGNRKDRVAVFTMWSSDASQSIFDIAHIYVHSKVAIIDDRWASVGTANVDGASLNQRQWRVILPGLFEKITDQDELLEATIIMWLPIIFLVLFATSPLLLLLPDIGPFLVESIKKEFARSSQHANPNRERQPPRHPEINVVVYDGIAGQPATGKVKELRDSLWGEHLGATAQNPLPATKPQDGWVKHWKGVAARHKTTIQNAAAATTHPPPPGTVIPEKILDWSTERDYDANLRSLGVPTKGIRIRDTGVTMPFVLREV